MVTIVVIVVSGMYGIEGKADRPCGFAQVRRVVTRPNGSQRVTQARLVDTGSAAQFTAEQVARGWALAHHRASGQLAPIETRHVDIGHIGTFANSDAGRDDYLAKMRLHVRFPSGAHTTLLDNADTRQAVAA